MAGKIYAGDIGTKIDLIITDAQTGEAVDVAQAASMRIEVQKPSGEVVVWSASPTATLGVIRHVAVAGDFDVAGNYQAQAVVDLSSWNGRSETVSVPVHAAFE